MPVPSNRGILHEAANPVFGERGDFITSPEISQVFGEACSPFPLRVWDNECLVSTWQLVAIWMLSQWINAGRPSSISLVELGPGRGTLMADILRVVSKFAGSQRPLKHIHLVETSLTMRELQKAKLKHDVLSAPSDYKMLIAHEFFDALPIHVLQKSETGWHEVMIASSDVISSKPAPDGTLPSTPPLALSPQSRLHRVLSPTPTATSSVLGASSPRFQQLPVGSRIEVSPAAFRIGRSIGELLTMKQPEDHSGGCALVIDYGGDHVYGDSFRVSPIFHHRHHTQTSAKAFKEHKLVDVFHLPGECDLTANVDFAFLKESLLALVCSTLPACSLMNTFTGTTYGPISQADFLERMGLHMRADALVRSAKMDERRGAIVDAARRLVDRTGMGNQYQVMGIHGGGSEADSTNVWPFMEVPQGPGGHTT
ncbi:S-adenosyl-L-methionine-dependent methyltransferase [Infundibulicybe gibba]|nr:S-adenosyl-L-methionine-dependent methyltransferase [Infundibulicybe gibba]